MRHIQPFARSTAKMVSGWRVLIGGWSNGTATAHQLKPSPVGLSVLVRMNLWPMSATPTSESRRALQIKNPRCPWWRWSIDWGEARLRNS